MARVVDFKVHQPVIWPTEGYEPLTSFRKGSARGCVATFDRELQAISLVDPKRPEFRVLIPLTNVEYFRTEAEQAQPQKR